MEQTLQIHPSQVNAALMCELRLDEDLAEDQPNRDMMRGSLTHHMIETDLLDQPMGPTEFVIERFADEYGYTSIEDAGLTMANIDPLITEALTAYNAWKANVKGTLALKDAVTEEEMTVFLGTREFGNMTYVVELVGTPDLVTYNGGPRIHDWKTAQRMWEPLKLTGQMQPPLYSALVFGMPTPFTFWIWDIANQGWWPLSITPTMTQMLEAQEQAIRLAIKREMGLLTATPGVPGFGKTRGWWCSPKYCRNWNKCTARSLTNDGNEATLRDWREDWQ